MNDSQPCASHRSASRSEQRRLLLEQVGLEVGHAVVEGTTLRYACSAGVGEPLLFCNGIGANFELALPLVRELKGQPVVLFDLPGVGGSPSALVWPSFARYARLARGLLDVLEVGGPFSVVGMSWGGGLALHLARGRPDRVRRMVLMATTFGRYMVPGKFSALRRMLTPQRYLSRDYMAQHAGTIYGGAMVGRPELAVELARLGRAPSVLGYAQQLAAIWQLNALPWLAEVRCPTLVLAGDDDPIVRPVNAQMLAARLPAARLHVIPRGGHMFMSTHAALTGRLIREFLDE